MIPSGNDSQAAHAVFVHIYSNFLSGIPLHRTEIQWIGPIYIALYGVSLIVFFFMLSTYLRHAGLQKHRLLELTAFSGHLTERVGKLAPFSFIVWTYIVLWALYFAVKHAVLGVIY